MRRVQKLEERVQRLEGLVGGLLTLFKRRKEEQTTQVLVDLVKDLQKEKSELFDRVLAKSLTEFKQARTLDDMTLPPSFEGRELLQVLNDDMAGETLEVKGGRG